MCLRVCLCCNWIFFIYIKCPIISHSWVIRKRLYCAVMCTPFHTSKKTPNWEQKENLSLYRKEAQNYTASYLLVDKTHLREPLLPGEIKASIGNRGGEKTAGTRRVMADRLKDWPPRVNRWLVTFIIATQAAQWEAWQPLSEEFSHILMLKSAWRQGPLWSTRCPVFMTETNVGVPKWKNMLHWHTAAAPAAEARYII